MAKAKIETQISSDDMKTVNDIGGTVWSGVFSVIDNWTNGTGFRGEEASKVAAACRKAAERALTKLLSTPVSAKPSNGAGGAEPSNEDDTPAVSEPYSDRLAPSAL